MKFKYRSGEGIRKGDRIIFHGQSGEVEFVVEEFTGDRGMDWYMKEFGGGVMVKEFGTVDRTFLREPQEEEDLEFVSRS